MPTLKLYFILKNWQCVKFKWQHCNKLVKFIIRVGNTEGLSLQFLKLLTNWNTSTSTYSFMYCTVMDFPQTFSKKDRRGTQQRVLFVKIPPFVMYVRNGIIGIELINVDDDVVFGYRRNYVSFLLSRTLSTYFC